MKKSGTVRAPSPLPTSRRAALAALATLPLALAACQEPGGTHLMGIGDPIRGAAISAPQTFGNMSRFNGRPAEAAEAAAQLEFLASAMPAHPRYQTSVQPTVFMQLTRARAEMRDAIGIRADAPADPVIAALRTAAAALRDGNLQRARVALTTSDFLNPPDVTLQRLGSLPRLPRSAEAAGGVAIAIQNLGIRNRGM
ncbi:hypothetical protein M0638_20265 [Roseomonas sp. NAR14]|uniref:Uncharacterized protein n=1 Tax=Roseomonas acroporae TaxID=2937791 RepID=A0A9X1YAT9_9PROT|nr:hypothetical protein [Roseomonas acroporae]MCK8786711.1 hypothetical protein [Roseomonas acroporae]